MATVRVSIKEASTLTGLSPSVLRIWELRYRWPKPSRKANGYRTYAAATIEDLKWVAGRVADGKAISELIHEGQLVRDDPPRMKTAPRVTIDFSTIPMPTTPEGRRLRVRLEQAISLSDRGQVAMVQSEAARLRPAEREVAVVAVLRAAMSP